MEWGKLEHASVENFHESFSRGAQRAFMGFSLSSCPCSISHGCQAKWANRQKQRRQAKGWAPGLQKPWSKGENNITTRNNTLPQDLTSGSYFRLLLPALRCSTCPKAPAHPHRTGTASSSVGMCHDTYQALTVTRPNLGIVDPKLSGGGFMEQSGGLGKQSQSL